MAERAAARDLANRIREAKRAYRMALFDIMISDEEAKISEEGEPVERLLALAAMEHLPIMSEESAAAARDELVAIAGEEVANIERVAVFEDFRRFLDEHRAHHAASASSHLCSLPGCTSPAPYMCSKCRSAYYCSEDHQMTDWKRHKPECRALSAKAGGRHKSRRSKRSKHSKRSTRKSKRRY